MNKVRFGFTFNGLFLFLIILIPNLIWFVTPAPNDILKQGSITPIADIIASICQVIMVICLVMFIHVDAKSFHIKNSYILYTIGCLILYYIGWGLYYCGIVNHLIILILCVAPCLAFIFYIIDRRNWFALLPAILFTILHIYYGIVNFYLPAH